MDPKEIEWESSSHSGQGPGVGSSEHGKEICCQQKPENLLTTYGTDRSSRRIALHVQSCTA